jgi:hypothetical protein
LYNSRVVAWWWMWWHDSALLYCGRCSTSAVPKFLRQRNVEIEDQAYLFTETEENGTICHIWDLIQIWKTQCCEIWLLPDDASKQRRKELDTNYEQLPLWFTTMCWDMAWTMYEDEQHRWNHNVVFQHPVARYLSHFFLVRTVLHTTSSSLKIN